MKSCPSPKFFLGHIRDILIVVLIGNVVTFFFNPDYINFWERIWMTSLYSLMIGSTLWKGNQFIGWLVHRRINSYKFPLKALRWSLAFMFVYSLVIIIIVNFIWYVIIFDNTILQMFQFGWISMIIEFLITIIITSIFFAIGFFKAWRESAVNEERLEKESILLQYNALKNQVNPHFLFNSLNTLTTLVYKDADLSARFIKQLSEIYRYVLEHKDTELVSLREEMNFCEKYMYLQKIRHGESLKINFDFKDDHLIRVVPLSLQLLLENAIKHNEVSEENPLEISVSIQDEYIVVSNKLQIRKSIPESGGIGLDTLKQRYAFLSETPFQTKQENGVFNVFVPVLKI